MSKHQWAIIDGPSRLTAEDADQTRSFTLLDEGSHERFHVNLQLTWVEVITEYQFALEGRGGIPGHGWVHVKGDYVAFQRPIRGHIHQR